MISLVHLICIGLAFVGSAGDLSPINEKTTADAGDL
jgi:hypothetical protein